MGKDVSNVAAERRVSHPRFTGVYTWMSGRPTMRRREAPLRREVVGQGREAVLEIGADDGQNFAFYDPDRVTRVEATEPDEAMLAVARRLADTRVPVALTRAPGRGAALR